MKRILKIWIIVKTLVTTIFLIYVLYNFFFTATQFHEEENELFVIELSFYTITSFVLIYFFLHMYQTMKYVIIFDLIFLFFIGYHFHMNYIILFLEVITFFLIMLDNTDLQNFVRRKLRRIHINYFL